MSTASDPELSWHNVTEWGVEGRAWEDHKRLRYFDRMPASAEKGMSLIIDRLGVASAWEMSRCSAGMMVRFRSVTTKVHIRYRLLNAELALPHMPATGVSGVDLYARNELGAWRYVNCIKPTTQDVDTEIISGLIPGDREYALYLPLYNGVEHMEIGISSDVEFAELPPRANPIVFYGTSVTQGGVASRPGACHSSLLGRRLDRPVVNLGFSGTGRMNQVVVDHLVQADASVFVIECSANMNPTLIRERCIPLVKQLRGAHPHTPILLVEDCRRPNAWISPDNRDFVAENHIALRECFNALQAESVTGISYILGDELFGIDGEGTTDNVHANDLGFKRMADVMEPILREALHLND
jgi:hypothetical protein